MSQLDVEIIKNNDPSIEFFLYDVHPSGIQVPANLSGAIVEFYIKPSRSEPDEAPFLAEVIMPATGGLCRVNLTKEDIVDKRTYHLDVIKDDRRTTYAYGALKKIEV